MTKKGLETGMKRQLVEFYDHEHLENIISLLYGMYESVTYVYFKQDNEPDLWERKMLRRFVPQKLLAEVRFLEIPENSISAAVESFRKLIVSGEYYDFDIAGGSPVFIAAAGMLAAEDREGRIALHEYDVATGTCAVCYPRDVRPPLRTEPIRLSVPDMFSLREITVLEGGQSVYARLKDEVLRGEIRRLWSVVRENFRAWNIFCTQPTAHTFLGNDGIVVEKSSSGSKATAVAEILQALQSRGILTDLQKWDDNGKMRATFRLLVRPEEWFLYDKGGNLLEMLTSLAVVESGLCADCCTGIKLDWEHKENESVYDPFNEIDVVAMRGHIPYFISCKNTDVTNEALYEIMTMTRHFGGAYAVPVMVSTLDGKGAIRARAKEMGVVLIDAVGTQTVEEFSLAMKKVLKRNLRRA